MNEKGIDEAKNHKKVYRPWGSFLSIEESNTWQIKKIDVNPGASLSLQMHFHRSEHWVVLNGTAKVEIGDLEKIIGPNESVYIPWELNIDYQIQLNIIDINRGSKWKLSWRR